jgi:proteasome accessory factor C
VSDIAADQLRRILAIVPELADDEEHAIEGLAVRLGVDRATLLGDLRSLTERFDDPGGFVEEGVALFIDGEHVSLTSPHFRRPMRLTSSELRALELGLAMLEGECPPEECAAIERARGRLRQALAGIPADDADLDRRHATLASAGDGRALQELRDALRRRRKVRLAYRRSGQEGVSERVVLPYALVVASGAWYSVAFCEASHGVRVFRLDRVQRAELLPDAYTVPATFSVAEVVRDGKVLRLEGGGEAAPVLTVRYGPRIARWIAEREGSTVDADGSLTMEHPLADAEWAVRHVLQYGADAEVVGPAHVRELVVRRLGEMTG